MNEEEFKKQMPEKLNAHQAKDKLKGAIVESKLKLDYDRKRHQNKFVN